jgi:geranylgeranyl pyrophosphate synthase
LALSFEILASLKKNLISPEINLKMIQILSHYIGSDGMAGGEALDTALKDQSVTLKKLALIYKLKTSYLICASILLGALSANCDEKNILENLEKFGLYIGLAFQIHDDIIGIESDTKLLGKPQGSDVINHKPTYPQLIGIPRARNIERQCFNKAMHYLDKAGIKKQMLVELSEFAITRQH